MKFIFLFLLPLQVFAANFVPSSFSAQYEETQKSLISGKLKKTFGAIDYKFPGNIRLELKTDPAIAFVANNEQTWYYTAPAVAGEQGQVSISKGSSHPVTKFLDSIKNGIEGSKIFTTKWENQDLKLTFNPEAQKEYSLKEVILHAKTNNRNVTSINDFDIITLHNVSGAQTHIKFIEIKEGVNFPAKHFVFSIPAKTKITK